MNFNKTTEYALRILSYMAADEAKLYSADEIFKNLKIPYRYLRKQLTILSKSGLMISVQGIKGGYKLAKPNMDISLLDIVSASGEDFISDMCFFGIRECTFGQKCAMHNKWAGVKENIRQVLRTTTLADLKIAGPPNITINNNFLNT